MSQEKTLLSSLLPPVPAAEEAGFEVPLETNMI